MNKRIQEARTYLKGLDALLFYGHTNCTYLSHYTGSDAIVLIDPSRALLFVDSRNTLQAREECIGFEVHEISRQFEDVYPFVCSGHIKTIGVESDIIDFDTFMDIRDIFKGVELTPLGKQLSYLRVQKDPAEINTLKEAALVSEKALEKTLEKGIVGRRECDVALAFEWEMRTLGASGLSFDLIVASGPRSAMPHGVASQRVICEGEPVLIDFGDVVGGYCSDQTVTLFAGEPTDEFTQIYAHVRKAQSMAIDALRPGIKASKVDAIARDYLAAQGLGRYFGHGLGHGVGMDVHEKPVLSPKSDDILEQGMVLTVEPGVYIPGKFGIRLEDTLCITDNSCMRITNLDKDAIRSII
ncbi:MAG: aminopeptidase P family protein [Thermodesulfobacteriota bacterium]|nr:aminopeptidase P family protein [Thermodesulfobacteriota bacterium]